MKEIILPLFLCLLFLGKDAFCQVTLLSNNTNLTSGFTLNRKGFLLQRNSNNVDSIWVTDGSLAGTTKFINTVAYIDTGGAVLYNNKVFFSGVTAATGVEM